MAKPIEVTNVQWTNATAEPVKGRMGVGAAFVAGVVVGAFLTGGWSVEETPTPAGDPVVQEHKSIEK